MGRRYGVLAALLCALTAAADDQPAAAPDPVDAAWSAAAQALQRGPQSIELRDQATLALPDGYGFVPRESSVPLMEAWGNPVDERFLGLVFPLSDESWFVTVDYAPSGYIEDDEAKDWDADAMLAGLKEGTEAGNERRAARGIPALEVTRWVEAPAYDTTSHRLVWSAEARTKGVRDDDPGVNYNTYVLGREGYVSLNLVTSLAAVDAHKPAAKELLAAVRFRDGKRYEDFDSSTDSVAAYGIAALIGGVAAKKLGLLALAAAFFAKFAKAILLALAAIGAFISRLLKRGRPQ